MRAIARDLGAMGRWCRLPRLADAHRRQDRSPLDLRQPARRHPGRRPPTGRTACCRWLLPLDTGLDAFPEVELTADEVTAIARWPVRRDHLAGGAPWPATADRLRHPHPDAAAIATAIELAGWLPDKAFHVASPDGDGGGGALPRLPAPPVG